MLRPLSCYLAVPLYFLFPITFFSLLSLFLSLPSKTVGKYMSVCWWQKAEQAGILETNLFRNDYAFMSNSLLLLDVGGLLTSQG